MMPISFRVGRKNTVTPKTGQKKAGHSLSLSWSFRGKEWKNHFNCGILPTIRMIHINKYKILSPFVRRVLMWLLILYHERREIIETIRKYSKI